MHNKMFIQVGQDAATTKDLSNGAYCIETADSGKPIAGRVAEPDNQREL